MNLEVLKRLDSPNVSKINRELIRDYLTAVTDADIDLEISPANWNYAIHVVHKGRIAGTVFGKSGKIKIYNRLPRDPERTYGSSRLNNHDEWVFTSNTESDVDLMLQCLRDNVTGIERESTLRPRAVSVEVDSRQIPRRLRFTVLYRDNFTCFYCGRKPPEVILHVDHREPFSLGGQTSIENLVTACSDCNLGKSNKFTT